MKTLYNGRKVPTNINIEEEVYLVITYDGDEFLCNLKTAYVIIKADECSGLKHFCNNDFINTWKQSLIDIYEISGQNKKQLKTKQL